jgi:PleD family two-component response regulator
MSKQLKLPTLLVIADNPTIRFWVKKHLDDRFFVICAEKRHEAIDALNSRLDFIIIDSQLESCNALDLCKEISKITQKSLVPILLVTGRLKKSFRDKAQQSGVSDFLSDQLDIDELEIRIATGKRAASARDKTVNLGLSIKMPTQNFAGGSLKNKFVLPDAGLKILAEAKRENAPAALLILQIDRFEELENAADMAGHLNQFIQKLLREKDLLIPSAEGRAILLLWNTKPDASRLIAERLREKIRLHRFSTKAGPQELTVSIAVSSLEASEKGFNKMIDAAVKSLKTHSETNLIISLDPEIL